MTNIAAVITITLVTNISNVQIHEDCSICETNPAHALPIAPRYVRRETTEVLEQAMVQFEFEGIPHTLAVNNRTVSRTVRRFKIREVVVPKLVEEELK